MTRRAAVLVTMLVAAAILTAVPAGAQDERPPVISVTPDQDLVDGQVVTVRAARFDGGADAAMAVCSAAVLDSLSLTDCDLPGARQFVMGAGGGARQPFTVRRRIVTDNGTVDCGAQARACLLGVATGEIPTQGGVILADLQSAWRYLHFAPGPLPTITGLAVEGATPDLVDVSITCEGSGAVSVAASISQPADGDVVASASGRARLRCTDRHRVTVAMSERDGRFRNGPAEVTVDAAGPTNDTSVVAVASIRGDRWYDEPATLHADGLDVWVKRTRAVDDEVRVRVHLRCPTPIVVGVSASASQLVRDGVVEADGLVPALVCDGPRDVTVPIRPINVFLTPGRTNIRVAVIGIESPLDVGGLAVAPADLDRLVRPQRWTQPAQPAGPVMLGPVSTAGITATADCTAAAALVSIRVLQRDGRRIAVTQASGPLPCTGQAATLIPSQPLAPGPAVLKVRTSLPGEITEQVFRRRVA